MCAFAVLNAKIRDWRKSNQKIKARVRELFQPKSLCFRLTHESFLPWTGPLNCFSQHCKLDANPTTHEARWCAHAALQYISLSPIFLRVLVTYLCSPENRLLHKTDLRSFYFAILFLLWPSLANMLDCQVMELNKNLLTMIRSQTPWMCLCLLRRYKPSLCYLLGIFL